MAKELENLCRLEIAIFNGTYFDQCSTLEKYDKYKLQWDMDTTHNM